MVPHSLTNLRKCTTDIEFCNYTLLTKLTPGEKCHGWSPTIPRRITSQPKDGHPPTQQWSTHLALFGPVLQHLTRVAHVWPHLVPFVPIWPHLTQFPSVWPCLALFGLVWPCVAQFGPVWPSLVLLGPILSFLVLFGLFQCIAPHLTTCCLTPSDPICPCLALFYTPFNPV